MSNLTPIYYDERLVAAVMPEHTLITADLDAEELRTVKAMRVYAAEIYAGRQDGPYTDQRALAYTQSVPPSRVAPEQIKAAGESDTSREAPRRPLVSRAFSSPWPSRNMYTDYLRAGEFKGRRASKKRDRQSGPNRQDRMAVCVQRSSLGCESR